MPNSRRRKQRVAESQRQLERARRKIKRSEEQVESEAGPAIPLNRLDKHDSESGDHYGESTTKQRVSPGPSTSAEDIEKEESKGGGWFGSLASVYTGLVHVCET